MREIKFRAWDKLSKQWVPGGYGFHILGEALLIGGLFQNMPLEMLNDIDLMQFTGLLDKNGKDIYEGDFVYIRDHWTEPVMDKVKAHVFYQEGAFWIAGVLLYEINHYCEIVGNIHETPELLNVRKA